MKYMVSFALILVCFSCNARKKMEKDEQKTREIVQDWIKKYAMYPETYKAINFTNYQVSCECKGVVMPKCKNCAYSCRHQFQLKNREGNPEEFAAYFTANDLRYVVMIEETRGNTTSVWPPETELFMTRFGRELTQQDKTEMLKTSEIIMERSLEELTGN